MIEDKSGDDMINCSKCDDTGWVCENHPNFIHKHKVIKWWIFIRTCSGAGMPCTCNTANPPWDFKPGTRVSIGINPAPNDGKDGFGVKQSAMK